MPLIWHGAASLRLLPLARKHLRDSSRRAGKVVPSKPTLTDDAASQRVGFKTLKTGITSVSQSDDSNTSNQFAPREPKNVVLDGFKAAKGAGEETDIRTERVQTFQGGRGVNSLRRPRKWTGAGSQKVPFTGQ